MSWTKHLRILLLSLGLLALHPGQAEELPDCDYLDHYDATRYAQLSVSDRTVLVELAYTEAHRRCGLMHREYLPSNGGMLFIYPSPRPLSFWMRDTSLALDLAFIAIDDSIVAIHTLKPFDDQPIHSPIPVAYVLEMGEGWFVHNGVHIGDRVDIEHMRRIHEPNN